MKKQTINARVSRIINKGYSYYGNPHYTVELETENGEHWECKTVVNGSIGYGLTNYCNKFGLFTYHETRNGSIMLDYAENVK